MLKPYFIEEYENHRYHPDIPKIKVYDLKPPILDPSAGKGNILDYLCNHTRIRIEDVYAIEIDYELRMILNGKKYPVIDTDFLQFNNDIEYNTIIMNPPFNNATKHILHAFQMLADGGKLIALCNTQVFKNPDSNQYHQKINQLVDIFGRWENFGNCFKDSERSTNVEVACIWLEKPIKEISEEKNYFNNFNLDDISENSFEPTQLAKIDVVKDLVDRYHGCVEILKKRNAIQLKLNTCLEGVSKSPYRKIEDSVEVTFDFRQEIIKLKQRFWQTIFDKTRIGQKTTTNFRSKFEDFAKGQVNLAFSEANINELLSLFMINSNKIFQDCAIALFDEIRKHHENNTSSEGWKSNKSAKINKKIVHPYIINNFYGRPMIDYRRSDFVDDLDKIMCWISGKQIEEILTIDEAIKSFSDKFKNNSGAVRFSDKIESEFFFIRCYKKGTAHFQFKSMELLKDLNRICSESKKEIGQD